MSILFAGTEQDALDYSGLTDFVTTPTDAFDGNSCRGATRIQNDTSVAIAKLPATFSGSEIWVHFNFYSQLSSITSYDDFLFRIRNAAGDEIFEANATNGNVAVAKYTSAGASLGTTVLPSSTGLVAQSLQTIDIQIVISTTVGAIRYYVDGVLRGEVTNVDTDDSGAGFNYDVGFVDFYSPTGLTGNNGAFFSEIIIADEDTRGMRVAYLNPDGAGANTAWTGDHTDVDEEVLNDSDLITTTSTGQNESFTFSNINAAFSGFTVEAVSVSMRASADGSPVGNLQAIARPGSTNNFSANLSDVTSSLNATQAIFAQNPDTVAAWSQSEVNASEFGVGSFV